MAIFLVHREFILHGNHANTELILYHKCNFVVSCMNGTHAIAIKS